MKKLAFTLLLVAGLTQATGCIIVADDDDTAQFRVSWTLTDSGATIACASVGAATTRIQSYDVAGDQYYWDLFDCSALTGDTSPLPLGDYQIAAQLATCTAGEPDSCFNVPANILSDFVPVNTSLDSAGQLKPHNFVFDFTPPTHSFTFKVDFGNAPFGGYNCQDTSVTGGSGAAQQKVQVVGSSSTQCISYEITGTDQEGVDFSHMTCTDTMLCMENTVDQTIWDLEDGSYTITVQGLKNCSGATAKVCYQGTYNVTMNGLDQTGIQIQAPFTDAYGCNTCKPEPLPRR